jgi:MoxR-like ATPase
MQLQEITSKAARLLAEIETVIVGKRDVIELAIAGLLSNGHILIEDIPGVGKTMLGRALARAVGGAFRRIQFTPDLLPADVTGTTIFNQKSGEFEFRPGPVFTNVLLADEINRATPKAQSSLLEAMEEFQVTVDGVTHELPRPFFVVATENPIEVEGVYILPEAQLDRFLMKLTVGYPGRRDEVEIIDRQMNHHPIVDVRPVLSAQEVVALQQAIREVYVDSSVKTYVVELVAATRGHRQVRLGASPRASLALVRAAQAVAALAGRDFVVPDDIKRVAHPVMEHRLIVKSELRVRGVTPGAVVEDVMNTVPVPILQTANAER